MTAGVHHSPLRPPKVGAMTIVCSRWKHTRAHLQVGASTVEVTEADGARGGEREVGLLLPPWTVFREVVAIHCEVD